MKLFCLFAVDDDGKLKFEETLLGVFATADDAQAFWDGLTDAARFGYYAMIEERTLGVGLVPALSSLAVANKHWK